MESLNIQERLITRREAIERAKAGGFKWVAITLCGQWCGFYEEPINYEVWAEGVFGWYPARVFCGCSKFIGLAMECDFPEHLSKVRIVQPWAT